MSADGLSLQLELDANLQDNESAIEEMRESGKRAARAEAQYRSAKAARMLLLRSEGYPATMAADIAKGDTGVTNAFVNWKCEEANFKADTENVMLIKRRIDVLREQISRDWQQSGGAM